MDIQRDEAFEEAFSAICKPVIARPYPRNVKGEYIYKEIHEAYVMWQEAKAQAVPEGFVLVPREPTEEMLGAAWEAPPAGGPSGNRRTFYERQAVVYKAMVEEAEKEIIEIQEQGHE